MILGFAVLLIWIALLMRYPKVMLPVSGVAVAIGILLAAGAATFQWLDNRRIDRLDIDISYAREQCEFGKPLRVEISNSGSSTATNISWQLIAVQSGFNSNLLDISTADATYRTDQALPAGEQWIHCYAVPRLRSGYRAPDLEYRADRIRANFE